MRTTLILFLLLFTYSSTQAQQSEKIYIHTDKDFYLPGETVWFKAYLLENNAVTSRTDLYTGLYSENGKLVSQKTYPIFNGAAIGDFAIPDTATQLNYQLRVYTSNKKVSAMNEVILPIRIYQKGMSFSEGPVTNSNEMEILPEGGTLVMNVNNHIVFKAAGITSAGIIDEAGKIIDSLYFDAEGYSKAQLTPLPGKSYFVSWKNNQQEIRKAIPAANNIYVALHTELSGNKLFYSISRNSSNGFNKLSLSLKEAEEQVYTEKLNLGDKMHFVNSFSLDSIGSGLYRILLTDEKEQVLQQKLVYIPGPQKQPTITLQEVSSAAKGKNIIKVQVNDSSLTTWSAAVVDANFTLPPLHPSIYDGLITGAATDRMYLDISNAKKTDMVLSGRPLRAAGLSGTKDNYLSVTANYQRSLNPGISLSMVINDKASGKQFYNFTQSSKGVFSTNGLIFYDSAKIYYQLTDKELTQNLAVTAPGLPAMPANISAVENKNWGEHISAPPTMIKETLDNFVQQKPASFNELQTIATVTVKSKYVNPITKRIQELDDKYTSGMFKGLARGQQINIIDDPSAQIMIDLFSYLPYRASGVRVERNSDGARIFVARNGPFIVFVDEVETPVELIENISMSRIAYVKVIPGIVAGSSFVTDAGAIYIYTKRGDEDASSLTMKSIMAKGYNLPSEFINPDYSDPKNSRPPDYRTTLYWNPFIITDKTNNSFTIEYFNNDISKGKLLRLVGLNSKGEPVEIEKRIE